jgi:hypothetical protein
MLELANLIVSGVTAVRQRTLLWLRYDTGQSRA